MDTVELLANLPERDGMLWTSRTGIPATQRLGLGKSQPNGGVPAAGPQDTAALPQRSPRGWEAKSVLGSALLARLRSLEPGVDGLAGALAVAHGENDGGRAADDVAAGEDAGDAGHALLVHEDIPMLV
jgi:hypothetical protein